MKNGWYLAIGVLMTVIGAAGVVSFVILTVGGERMLRWVPALVVSALLLVSGVRCIIDYRKNG